METGHSIKSSAAASTRWTGVVTAIQQVYSITEQLFHLLTKPVDKDQREDHINKITELLDEREQHILQVKAPFSADEKKLFNQVVAWNETIEKKFVVLKQQIQQDMVQLKKSKSSNQQYTNPYQHVSTSDGMFYDKRK